VLLRLSLALALTLTVTLACMPGRPAPAAPGATGGGYRASAPARPGGTVVLADYEYPESLDPLTAATDLELRLGLLLFAPLWGFDPQLRPYADLAGAVPALDNGGVRVAADGRTTTVDVRLVPGLRWSDGQPITADDVIFTWRAMADPATPAARPLGFDRIRSMERRSDTEVVWTLDGVDPAYLQLGAGLYVMPAHRLQGAPRGDWGRDAYFRLPDVVSGPFAISETDGRSIVLTANPQYADGRAAPGAYAGAAPFTHGPYLQRVVFQALAGRAGVVRAMVAGGADVGFHLLPDDLVDLRAAAGSAPVITTGLRDELLSPNHAVNSATGVAPPWVGDHRVLEALTAAVDRTALVRDVLAGEGRPARGLFPRALAGFAGEPVVAHGPDVAAARRLLDRAGWAPGGDGVRARGGRRLEFTLLGICGRTGIDRELDRVRRQWLPLGAAVTTGCQDRDTFLRQAARGGFDMTAYSNRWAPDPGAWADAGVTGRTGNWSRCQDPPLDAAFARGGSTMDAASRRAAYRDAEREWLRYGCTIPLFEWPEIRQVSGRLRNFAPAPGPSGDTWNAADWWAAPSPR
jgi:peptide/nickel transport system substrate-binding protein